MVKWFRNRTTCGQWKTAPFQTIFYYISFFSAWLLYLRWICFGSRFYPLDAFFYRIFLHFFLCPLTGGLREREGGRVRRWKRVRDSIENVFFSSSFIVGSRNGRYVQIAVWDRYALSIFQFVSITFKVLSCPLNTVASMIHSLQTVQPFRFCIVKIFFRISSQ